jgi:hypothetical protein
MVTISPVIKNIPPLYDSPSWRDLTKNRLLHYVDGAGRHLHRQLPVPYRPCATRAGLTAVLKTGQKRASIRKR